jgi:FMN-dependent NADH-azoreductase
MTKILHIQSSPRSDRSASLAVAQHFLDAYSKSHPTDTIETLNLWDTDLPEFNGATIDAKYAVLQGQPHTPGQLEAWKAVTRIADQFKSADKLVFSVPMWNFGIPYKLKHYIDVLVQPGLAITFTPGTGFSGLITGKPAVVICSRGGAYGAGSGAEQMDMQSSYMRQILSFIGFSDIREIFVEPTGGPGARDSAVAKANPTAAEIARVF